MKVVSVNVGLPREVPWQDKIVTTAIFKEPVSAPVMMHLLNLDGDRQADLHVHGGVDKAIYGYPSEYYEYWRTELSGVDLPWGVFGENLTTMGLFDETVYIGDKFRIGDAEVRVTQPRMPCYKLGLRFQSAPMVKRFLNGRRTGFYFAVIQSGMVSAGDPIELTGREQEEISVADIVRLYAFEKDDFKTMQRALEVEALPQSWKSHFQVQLEKSTG